MIFLSGIHGVGKSFFAKVVRTLLGLNSYSASSLIAAKMKRGLSTDKKVDSISDNQKILLKELDIKRRLENEFILDGHFCLMNKVGNIERISIEIFQQISPSAILLLMEDSEVIAKRRLDRDGIVCDKEEIVRFQTEERNYALEVADILSIPIFISSGSADLKNAINFIKKVQGGEL